MKKFEGLGKRLDRQQMKNVLGGTRDEELPPGDGGGNCLSEYSYSCNQAVPYGLPCCAGLNCEVNATNSGTICVPPR